MATVAVTHFSDRLAESVERKRSGLVVGLDPVLAELPDELHGAEPADALVRFCCGIVDAVEAVRAAGLVVRTAVCVVDREEGGADALARHAVRLRPIFLASELLAARKIAAKPHG